MSDHPKSREDQMVVVSRSSDGTPSIWCDPEIVDIITALNNGGLATVASCSGHGFRPGFVALADGRWLILATDAERNVIDAVFPLDINGDRAHAYECAVQRGATELEHQWATNVSHDENTWRKVTEAVLCAALIAKEPQP